MITAPILPNVLSYLLPRDLGCLSRCFFATMVCGFRVVGDNMYGLVKQTNLVALRLGYEYLAENLRCAYVCIIPFGFSHTVLFVFR